MFKAYVLATIGENEERMPPVTLKSMEELWNYVRLQMVFFDNMIVEDENEYIVLEIKNKTIEFPLQLKGRYVGN